MRGPGTGGLVSVQSDRKGERPREHLADYRGVIQADAFSGYIALTRAPPDPGDGMGDGVPIIRHAACWAHARRKFHELFEATGSPVAGEALARISVSRSRPSTR